QDLEAIGGGGHAMLRPARVHSSAGGRGPSEHVAQPDRLVALGADGKDDDPGADERLQTGDVAAGGWGARGGSGGGAGRGRRGRGQPGSSSYTGRTRSQSRWRAGGASRRRPSTSYATQTRSGSTPVRTSILVSARPSTPESATAWRTRTASNQPQRRGRPVVEPYSSPSARRRAPSASGRSGGNGPPPTPGASALAMPTTRPMAPRGRPP